MRTSAGIVIIGASLAGATTAEALRVNHSYDGPITLIGAEEELPYQRPALSKDFLLGTASSESLRVLPASAYADHQIDLILGRTVTDLSVDQRFVRTDAGEEISFDQAVLATGASPRRLAIPGANLPGVHHLRSHADSIRLREALQTAESVVIVGGGWLGSELASSCRQLGRTTTMIEPMPTTLHQVLGGTLGQHFTNRHRDQGVTVLTGDSAKAFQGTDVVEAVQTQGGTTLDADLVIVCVGAIPNVVLAERAGLTLSNGIAVDHTLRSSNPAVLAVGDVAHYRHRLYREPIRVEHWENARSTGALAAATLAGAAPTSTDEPPYFFSTQYQSTLERVGRAEAGDRVVTRGDFGTPGFTAYWLNRHDVPVAAMAMDTWGAADPLKSLITRAEPVDEQHLGTADRLL